MNKINLLFVLFIVMFNINTMEKCKKFVAKFSPRSHKRTRPADDASPSPRQTNSPTSQARNGTPSSPFAVRRKKPNFSEEHVTVNSLTTSTSSAGATLYGPSN